MSHKGFTHWLLTVVTLSLLPTLAHVTLND